MLELMGLGFISGCLVSISLGFIFFLLIETAISKGFPAAFSVILAVLVGDAMLLALALVFSQTLGQMLADFGSLLQSAAGLMFVGMGLFQFWRPQSGSNIKRGGSTHFLQAFLINIGNPSNWTFWLVLYSAPPVSLAGRGAQLAFGISALLSIVLCSSMVSLAAAKTGKHLPESGVLRINQAVSVGLVAVGLYWLFGIR